MLDYEHMPMNLVLLFWHYEKRGRMIIQVQQLFEGSDEQPSGIYQYNPQVRLVFCTN